MEERTTTREEKEDAKRSLRQYFVSFLDSNIHEFNKYRFSDEMTTIKVRYDVLNGITKIFKVRKYTIYNTPTLFGEIKKIFIPPPLWNEFKIITMDNKLIPDSNPLSPDVIIIAEKSDTDLTSFSSKKRKNDDENNNITKKSKRRIDDSMDEQDYGRIIKNSRRRHPTKKNPEQLNKKKKNVTFDFNKNSSITIERDPLKSQSQDYLYAKTLPDCNYKEISFPCKISKSYFTSEEDYQDYLSLKKSKKGKKGKKKHYKKISKKFNINLQKSTKKTQKK